MQNFFKPEYLWRPTQVLRRLTFSRSNGYVPFPLPWNCKINACSSEVIGRSIASMGLYDLPLTEAITRLADQGDTALDVGANIGYMALVLARAIGPTGHVTCFEPNLDLLPTLRSNVDSWRALPVAEIQVQSIALSDRDGYGLLGFPDAYAANNGVASLEIDKDGVQVPVCRLDSIAKGPIGLMKVDVEGHETSVFRGAEKLLARKRIRDIFFEEHQPYPAVSHKILLEHGYYVFRLTRSTWRPLLLSASALPRQSYLPSNFVATLDPSRALARFSEWGWFALSRKLPC